MTPFQYLSCALGVLLLASLAGNAWQYHQHDEYVRAEAQARQFADDTKAAAGACTASVEQLRKDGLARQAQLVQLLKSVAPAVAASQKEALTALNAKPDNPQDLCGSLERYLRTEVKAEKK